MSRRRLACSFVTVVAATTTLAAASACHPPPPSPEYARNPPGIEPTPETPESDASVVVEQESPDPGSNSPSNTDQDPELPEAQPGQPVRRGTDGKCWVAVDIQCPPPESGMTCNPPPPMEVKCPDQG